MIILNSNIFRQSSIYFYCISLVFIFISCGGDNRQETLFTKIPAARTEISFKNTLVENDSINILKYLSAYNGGGIGAGDFNNDGLIDLYFVSNQQANALYINRGDLRFEDVTRKANVAGLSGVNTWTNGVTLVDINDDGWLDIYICQMNGHLGLEGRNQLFVNNRDETFSEQAADYNLDIKSYAQHSSFFDYDKDGDLDMFLLNQAVHSKESFKPAANRKLRNASSGDKLLENVDGKYVDVSIKAGIYGGAMGYGLAVSVGDINNDGWPDIYVSNDFHENDYLYYNQGDGTFKENIKRSTGHLSESSMGNDIADYDNDGDIDIVTLDMKPPDEVIAKQTTNVDPYQIYQYKLDIGYHYQFTRNMLQQNLGPLFAKDEVQFSEIGQLMGVSDTDWSWSAIMEDLDNDGRKDLFVSNGIPRRPNSLDYRKLVNENKEKAEATPSEELIALMPEGESSNLAYRNVGDRFIDVSEQWGLDWYGCSNGAVFTDLDNDGDLDLVLNNLNSQAMVFKNQTSEETDKQYVKVILSKDGKVKYIPGVRIEVISGENVQLKELKSTSGWLSSYVGPLIFGLDDVSGTVKIKVTWPDDKVQYTEVTNFNKEITIKYEDANYTEGKQTNSSNRIITDLTDISGIDFIHRENDFVDFTKEPLMPHFLSTQGPKLAVGDINGDGMEDFFIGGSKNQSGKVFLQTGDDKHIFREGNNSDFEGHKYFEDAGTNLVDVDNDGDLDLYVASGGGEPGSSASFQDRLYFNDGNGNFTYIANALPEIRYNSSCVVSLDVNADGAPDFFIGGRSIPGKYGISGVSRLLVNDGKGFFTDETEKYFDDKGRIGMVTDAAWISQTNELIVVGEWMSIGKYTITRGKSTYQGIPNSSGWWNTLLTDDLDNDGDIDFLVGNMGLNLNLSASKEYPVELYVKDFDGNLTIEPIIAYYKNGKHWVFPELDALSKQMPALSQVFPVYRVYANKTFEEIFPEPLINKSTHLQTQILASVIVENTDQGYEMKALPLMSQVSPIFGFAVDDFDNDGIKDILAAGNLYSCQPSIGKLDASFGTYLKGEGSLEFEYIEPIRSGFAIKGEVRDIKLIDGSYKNKLILISRNDSSACLLK